MRKVSRRISICLALLAAPFFLQAQSTPPPTGPSMGPSATSSMPPPMAMVQLRSAWTDALQHKNLEASLALFEPNAIFLSADGSRFEGQAAIRTLYQGVLATYTSQIALATRRLDCARALCIDDGEYRELMTETATGIQKKLAGSYILIARQANDGAWKISQLVWTGAPPK